MEYQNVCKKCIKQKPVLIKSELYQVVKDGPVHIRDGNKDRYVCGIKFLDTDIKLQQNMKLLDAE